MQDAADVLSTSGVSDFLAPHTITHNLTMSVISLPSFVTYAGPTTTSATTAIGVLGGFQAVTSGTNTTIGIKLNNWTMTTGTIKTVVRYT